MLGLRSTRSCGPILVHYVELDTLLLFLRHCLLPLHLSLLRYAFQQVLHLSRLFFSNCFGGALKLLESGLVTLHTWTLLVHLARLADLGSNGGCGGLLALDWKLGRHTFLKVAACEAGLSFGGLCRLH